MQRQSLFQGQWQLKWSAGIGSLLLIYLVSTCMMGVSDYITGVGDFFALLAGLLLMVFPMVIGIVFNWIGALKKKRWALICALVCYVFGSLSGLVFLIYNLAPMILVAMAIYKMNKKPTIKPPRL